MKRHFYSILILAFVSVVGCQAKTIAFNNPDLYYQGRMIYLPNAAEFSWSGNSVSINFKGTTMSAILQDKDTANYYNIIVDNRCVGKIHTSMQKQTYVLASGLNPGKHTVELFKRTEWDKGKTLFYGFVAPKNTKVLPWENIQKRKMEFYGNSITCGYGVEDNHGNSSPIGYFENSYVTYAALTARHFNACFSSISKSGIGIMVSWFPLIMPEMYDRLDATNPNSKWDFKKYTPDVVVINLFQNDSWIVKKPHYPTFISRFGTTAPTDSFIVASYKNFVTSIRSKYPHASIICVLGNMDATRVGSPWPGYVKKAVAEMHDKKIYTDIFPYKNTGGHPNVAEQKMMADSLIAFINRNIKW